MVVNPEATKNMAVVKNAIDHAGMSEPTYWPLFRALANAATGKRFYRQPFNEVLES